MQYRKLGKTDIQVSAVGMGCWPFAGGGPWGSQEDSDSIAAVHAALDLGVTLFDTAEGYGDGRSEEVLGRALQGRRDQAIIATKVSSSHLTWAGVRAACEQSLRRLRTDYIDLYQIHWPSRETPLAETVSALQALQAEGKVRAIGVCNFGPQDLSEFLALGRCESDQLSYSLIWRALEYEIQPLCLQHEVSIICWGPLSEGLLTGKFATPDDVPEARASTRHFSKDRPGTSHGEPGYEGETFAALARIRHISQAIGAPMAVVSLAWLLHRPGVACVLAGSRNPAQIQENARAADLALSPQWIDQLSQATEELREKLGPGQDMYLSLDKSRIR